MSQRIERIVRQVALTDSSLADREDAERSTAQQRFDSVEELRRVYFGYDDHPPRLDRVLECASLGEHKVSSDWSPRPRVDEPDASGRKKDLVDVALLEELAGGG